MTKIIHWTFLFFPHLGGISTHIDSIVNNMPEYEHEVATNGIPHTQLVERYSANTIIKRFNPVDVFHFPSKRLKRRYSLPYGAYCEVLRTFKQKRYFKNTDFELLHVHETDKNLVFLDIALNTNIFSKWSLRMYNLEKIRKPKVLTKHFLTVKNFHHPKLIEWDNIFISLFENIICVDVKIFEEVTKYFESTNQEKNVWFIPNGIDIEKFKYVQPKNEEKLKVGIVGRLSAETGEKFLIEFLNTAPEFIEFYWACSERAQRVETLKRAIKNANVFIYPNVNTEEMPNFYSNIDVLFNPIVFMYNVSRVTLEAMACGRPVIMFPGSRYPLINEENGFIINHDVDAVISLLGDINFERDKIMKMGETSRRIIEKEFSSKVVIPKIKKVYDTIIEKDRTNKSL